VVLAVETYRELNLQIFVHNTSIQDSGTYSSDAKTMFVLCDGQCLTFEELLESRNEDAGVSLVSSTLCMKNNDSDRSTFKVIYLTYSSSISYLMNPNRAFTSTHGNTCLSLAQRKVPNSLSFCVVTNLTSSRKGLQ